MNDTELINWLNWYVQNDEAATFEEEDGGMVLTLRNDGCLVGDSVRDVLRQAAEAYPVPEDEK